MNIVFYHDRIEVQNKFLTKNGNVSKRKDGKWGIRIKVICWFCPSGSEHVLVKFLQVTGFEVCFNILFQWDPVSKDYHGQLFKVNVSYTVERTLRGDIYLIKEKDCFVFKSSGSINGEIFQTL